MIDFVGVDKDVLTVSLHLLFHPCANATLPADGKRVVKRMLQRTRLSSHAVRLRDIHLSLESSPLTSTAGHIASAVGLTSEVQYHCALGHSARHFVRRTQTHAAVNNVPHANRTAMISMGADVVSAEEVQPTEIVVVATRTQCTRSKAARSRSSRAAESEGADHLGPKSAPRQWGKYPAFFAL